MVRRVAQITATPKDKDKNSVPSETAPKKGEEDKKQGPVLWPETTEPAPTFEKLTKKRAKK